jgi:hypothetical protein
LEQFGTLLFGDYPFAEMAIPKTAGRIFSEKIGGRSIRVDDLAVQ